MFFEQFSLEIGRIHSERKWTEREREISIARYGDISREIRKKRWREREIENLEVSSGTKKVREEGFRSRRMVSLVERERECVTKRDMSLESIEKHYERRQ